MQNNRDVQHHHYCGNSIQEHVEQSFKTNEKPPHHQQIDIIIKHHQKTNPEDHIAIF